MLGVIFAEVRVEIRLVEGAGIDKVVDVGKRAERAGGPLGINTRAFKRECSLPVTGIE